MYALIDCNNFYASCERLFRPDLHYKPIIVLSNNDGCVIARSNEAKQLGIAMGEPYFKIKALCHQHRVAVFSSNFALYGDLSERVMSTIKQNWPHMEIYSIDEAFLDLSSMPLEEQTAFCTKLQKIILQNTGIPTSIGIGATKTLAKIGNHICKRVLYIPVFHMYQQQDWLKQISVGDVWGVGRQWQKTLKAVGICTAHDLATVTLLDYKHHWNVSLLRTAMELRGIVCFQHTEQQAKKSIISSKSFGEMQTDFAILAQALSSHCARAYDKLRAEGLVVHALSVFIQTNQHRSDLPSYYNAIEVKLPTPTDDLRAITTHAKDCLRKIFKTGFDYKKIGVRLDQLSTKNTRVVKSPQLNLFENPPKEDGIKTEKMMTLLDQVKQKFGRHTIKLAAEGNSKTWLHSTMMRSPCYTTRWDELPRVR
jgi:DNA polymerase V